MRGGGNHDNSITRTQRGSDEAAYALDQKRVGGVEVGNVPAMVVTGKNRRWGIGVPRVPGIFIALIRHVLGKTSVTPTNLAYNSSCL
jgi:hypothetical protein